MRSRSLISRLLVISIAAWFCILSDHPLPAQNPSTHDRSTGERNDPPQDDRYQELAPDDLTPDDLTPDEAAEFFATQVEPILRQNCFECHGGDQVHGNLILTNRDGLLRGGDSGPAIDLEQPEFSLLLEAVNYDFYQMPPTGQLPAEQIKILTRWVELGVPWKGEGERPQAEHAAVPEVNEQTKSWWSFQPVERPDVPVTDSDWPTNEIDQFILRQLQQHGLQPNPPADRRVLIRRLYYDLIGLPPTPEQVAAFLADDSPDAYERLVDELLDSPHYGEKWARHWLDLVRYGESNSYERDGTKPYVWRYRDYVIRSFNEDKPYDEFLREQLAGDEYDEVTPERIIATGYYRLGIWDDEPADPELAWYDDMDDILATTSQTMLGLTIDCARCHDHKIDPIPQEDYYRFLSFFRNVQRYGVRSHESVLSASTRTLGSPELQEQYAAEVAEYERQVRENRQALQAIEQLVKEHFEPVELEEFQYEMNRVPLVRQKAEAGLISQQQAETYAELFREMLRLRNEKPAALERALSVTEPGIEPPPTHLLIRGNPHAVGKEVEPGFPSVLSPPEPEIVTPAEQRSSGRRMALARWIAGQDNPLTARVMVNRIWQYHFRRGIVRTTSDFGFQGSPPTHPELLDWLAAEFIDGGWTIKRMHKLLLMSNTYRMSSSARPEALAQDPLNDHFWRMEMRRLTAEEVRDSILAVNATLNLEKMFGPSIYPKIPAEVMQGQSRPGENWGDSSPEDRARRSIYVHIKRSLPVPILAAFDVADPDTPCPARFETVQPTQALEMINSEFVNEQARLFAESLIADFPDQVTEQVAEALRRTTQREPSPHEIDRGVAFIDKLRDQQIDDLVALKHFCLVALNLNEFLFLD